MKHIISSLLALSTITFADINVSKTLDAGWNLVSIPVTTSKEVQTLFNDDFDGSYIWKYGENGKWEMSKLVCNGGCSTLSSFNPMVDDFKTLEPMDGFWIHTPKEVTLSFPNLEQPPMIDVNSYDTSVLSDEQKYALAYMWHEEKLAYDIYSELYKVQAVNQLTKIATNSEIKHVESVEALVEKYDINITNLDDFSINYSKEELEALGAGEYAIESIQNLYNVLYEKGVQSTQDALEVGCMVEVTDINDLDEYIEISEGADDLVDVFTSLRSGSYSHYWSFDKGLKNMGIVEGCCVLGDTYCKTTEEYPQNEHSEGH
ncbi:MAG: DUF2202 domain-containing protein [Campylobacterales bacterium]|nr:DUF2202 domain-containing protein [Campylobacterales bacterium]